MMRYDPPPLLNLLWPPAAFARAVQRMAEQQERARQEQERQRQAKAPEPTRKAA